MPSRTQSHPSVDEIRDWRIFVEYKWPKPKDLPKYQTIFEFNFIIYLVAITLTWIPRIFGRVEFSHAALLAVSKSPHRQLHWGCLGIRHCYSRNRQGRGDWNLHIIFLLRENFPDTFRLDGSLCRVRAWILSQASTLQKNRENSDLYCRNWRNRLALIFFTLWLEPCLPYYYNTASFTEVEWDWV